MPYGESQRMVNKLPLDFIKKCKSVKAKRPRTVIDHILKIWVYNYTGIER